VSDAVYRGMFRESLDALKHGFVHPMCHSAATGGGSVDVVPPRVTERFLNINGSGRVSGTP
jgi:hypothetical protein